MHRHGAWRAPHGTPCSQRVPPDPRFMAMYRASEPRSGIELATIIEKGFLGGIVAKSKTGTCALSIAYEVFSTTAAGTSLLRRRFRPRHRRMRLGLGFVGHAAPLGGDLEQHLALFGDAHPLGHGLGIGRPFETSFHLRHIESPAGYPAGALQEECQSRTCTTGRYAGARFPRYEGP